MNIKSLSLRFGFHVDFDHSYLSGANIAIYDLGDSYVSSRAMLDVIAAFTGADSATRLFAEKYVERIHLTVAHAGERWNFDLRDGVVTAEMIDNFKRALPHRTSFVTAEESLAPERRDPAVSLFWTKDFLRRIDLDIERQFVFDEGEGADFLVTGGAQREFLRQGFQIPPDGVPMLLDDPEAGVHMSVRPYLRGFYDPQITARQMFVRTCCPQTAKSFMRGNTNQIVIATDKIDISDLGRV